MLLSSQWFFTAAETIGKWISEDLLASEKRSKPSEKVYEQIYQCRSGFKENDLTFLFSNSNYSCNPGEEIMKQQYYIGLSFIISGISEENG